MGVDNEVSWATLIAIFFLLFQQLVQENKLIVRVKRRSQLGYCGSGGKNTRSEESEVAGMQRNLRANKDSLYLMQAICSSLPETSTTLLININILEFILALLQEIKLLLIHV